MTTMVTETEPRPQTDTGDGEVAHIVGRWQSILDTLRLKIPRALCGVLLIADPDRPGPNRNSPICPRCAEINGQHRG